MEYFITSFYAFFPIAAEQIDSLRDRLSQTSEQQGLRGLVILATEGSNGTVAGSQSAINAFKSTLEELFGPRDWKYKDSQAPQQVFKRMKVKIRQEIVTSKNPNLLPYEHYRRGENHHLTPQQWHEVLTRENDYELIDVRNWYETDLGSFRDARIPETYHFSEFSDYIERSGIPKDKKILMCCTGGVRCEKAILEMNQQGYRNVYQLDGGILKYLEEYPDGEFSGECFVFDDRVAVTPDLKPSTRYALCPHCGQPGEEAIKCVRCGKDAKICDRCQKQPEFITCSHDCAYHAKRLGVRNEEMA